MIPFELDNIIELTNRSSFEKGEDYYNSGSVKKIIKTGNKFEGIVIGSSTYKVTLNISNDKLDFHCNCPYDFGGICKHSVAFAIAILNEDYYEKPEAIAYKNTIEFKELFKNADTQEKLNFLQQLLDKDTDLQSQFIEYSQKKPICLDTIIGVNIDKIRASVYAELSSIDFDEIMENYDNYDNNYYDDEGNIDAAYDEIRNVLNSYFQQSVSYLKKGNLLDGTRIILGMYEGIQNLPEIEESDYEIFSDSYENEALRIFSEELDDITKVLEQTIKSDDRIYQVVDLIMQRFDLCEIQPQDNASESLHYNMKVFENIFLSLIINKETANYLHALLKKNDLECLSMAYVLLKIAEITVNENLWIETAENFAELEPNISKLLLEKYKEKKDLSNFNRISELAFSKWPDKFAVFIIDNIDKESKKTLYIEALNYYASHNQSSKHYKILREYLTEDEKKEFVDKIGNTYNYLFYIQLLDIEKRFADILSFAQNKHNQYYEYEKILMPIANIYPEDCFEIIRKKCNMALQSTDKNRKTYQHITELLRVMILIVSKHKEAKEYIDSLYNHKPNLPALKDEIRKAKLIN